jgi:hypothetical protein
MNELIEMLLRSGLGQQGRGQGGLGGLGGLGGMGGIGGIGGMGGLGNRRGQMGGMGGLGGLGGESGMNGVSQILDLLKLFGGGQGRGQGGVAQPRPRMIPNQENQGFFPSGRKMIDVPSSALMQSMRARQNMVRGGLLNQDMGMYR